MAAGLALGFIGVCLFIKADWAELSVTLGFPTWSDNSSPCPCCMTPNIDELFFKFTTWTSQSLFFDDTTEADYLEAVAFAFLAKKTLNHEPGNIKSVTGANDDVILGGIYLA